MPFRPRTPPASANPPADLPRGAAFDERLRRVEYVRFESMAPNARGVHPGVFALANGLAQSGRLSSDEFGWWRASNDWFNVAYPDPATTDPSVFDKSAHPFATCWFKSTAGHLLARVPDYLDLLDRHGIAWRERREPTLPGRVLYEDDVQVVVERVS